jgi:hypothetical protein
LASLAAQASVDHVRETLAAGDYHAAWEVLGGEQEELTRSLLRAEILYRAGDPAGALLAARAGLGIDPGQIELLYRATGAAVWLEDEADAAAYSERLLRAADAMAGEAPERSAWRDAARDLATRSEALTARQQELGRALARLRLVAVGGVASWLVGLWFALRRQGRSSNPVS